MAFPIVLERGHLAKILFVVGVTVIAVTPRMPFDKPWSIGGSLSNGFRKTLLLIVAIELIRMFALKQAYPSADLFLHAVEGSFILFLSLLTPYLLRVWMQGRINIPGGRQPGKGLMPWVQLFVVLTFTGVLLRIWTDSLDYWIGKKIADTLSFIPVVRTMTMYNTLTSPRGSVRYPGRGSVLSQIVVAAEYYALFANGTDALSKAFKILGWVDDDFTQTEFMKGLYMDNTFASFTRILCHSVLLNVLDESTSTTPSTEESSSSSPSSGTSSRHHSHWSNRDEGRAFVETVAQEDGLIENGVLVKI